MNHVEGVRMRLHRVIPLVLATAALAACDQRNPTVIASLGGVTFAGAPATFFVTPTVVRLFVGQTFQLTAVNPDSLRSAILWRSLQPRIAVVTNTGLVTALATGRATIVARLAADTNRVAPATIFVSGVLIP